MTLRPVQRPQLLPHRLELPTGHLHVWCQTWPLRTSGTQALTGYLERYCGAGPAALAIRRGVNGKPEVDRSLLVNDPALRFNLSHSHDRLALAFSRTIDPGVDIECIRHRPNALAIARRFFPAAEARWLSTLPECDVQRMFHRIWCLREAVAKALGEDVGFALNSVEFAADAAGEPRLVRIGDEGPACWQLHDAIIRAAATGGGHDYQIAVCWRGDAQDIEASWLDSPFAISPSGTPPAVPGPAAVQRPTPVR